MQSILHSDLGHGDALSEQAFTASMDVVNMLIVNKMDLNKNQLKTSSEPHYYRRLLDTDEAVKWSQVLTEKRCMTAMMKTLEIAGVEGKTRDGQKYWPTFSLPSIFPETGDERGYFEMTGFKSDPTHSPQLATVQDSYALLGRNSETKMVFTENEIQTLKNDVISWCKCGVTPKMLAVDLTITKSEDEILKVIQSPEIQKLIKNNKLNVMLGRSEQKQQSLGRGKFSAGSASIISADSFLINKVNNAMSQVTPPDHNIATFYREKIGALDIEVMEKQTKTAESLCQSLKENYPGVSDYLVANGPFVHFEKKSGTTDSDCTQLEADIMSTWPKSESFGFSKTTWTNFANGINRVSVGFETAEDLMSELEKKAGWLGPQTVAGSQM